MILVKFVFYLRPFAFICGKIVFNLNDRQHIALVIDQYGSAVGVVTLEDVIETLLGLEIVDEHDEEVDMQAFARNQWKIRAKKMGLEVPGTDAEQL